MPDLRRILIVRPSALGDVVRTVPCAVTLRRAHPEATIDWLVHEDYADAIRHHPALSGVIAFPRRRFAAVWRHPAVLREFFAWARDLADRQYDLAIDFQALARSGLFTWLSHARHRLGFDHTRELAWLGYNRTHLINPDLHTVDHMLALLRADGYETSDDMALHLADEHHQWAAAEQPDPYICIAPTAKWRCKCWPIDRYVEIARRLQARGKKVIALAAPQEHSHIQPLLDFGVECPETDVAQLCALIARCDLLICNDSAPLHIAVGFDRPIVTLFGPTDPAKVGPYRRDDTVIQPQGITAADITRYRSHSDQTLISRVTTDEVWHRIEPLL